MYLYVQTDMDRHRDRGGRHAGRELLSESQSPRGKSQSQTDRGWEMKIRADVPVEQMSRQEARQHGPKR